MLLLILQLNDSPDPQKPEIVRSRISENSPPGIAESSSWRLVISMFWLEIGSGSSRLPECYKAVQIDRISLTMLNSVRSSIQNIEITGRSWILQYLEASFPRSIFRNQDTLVIHDLRAGF